MTSVLTCEYSKKRFSHLKKITHLEAKVNSPITFFIQIVFIP
ncbi:hypothetical protein HanRHA438_Chr12g0574591 [Helianthus annuus]|nr:hypothetical protein HanRHA438_Chr12g0574591 [Helianthus annuus]